MLLIETLVLNKACINREVKDPIHPPPIVAPEAPALADEIHAAAAEPSTTPV